MALVARGFVTTRSRARDAVRRGLVRVEGTPASKPGLLIAEGERLEIAPEAGATYVSRGALKLAAALDAFAISPAGLVCLDIGASTGGFSQVLLERGACRVYAIDVGHGQLAPLLAADPRLVSREGTDARGLTRADVPEAPALVTADVSFIALSKALAVPMSLAAPGARLVALVKPQFEAGRKNIGRGGIVHDETARRAALAGVEDWIGAQPGWHVAGRLASPIKGGSGNVEYLVTAVRDA